MQDSSNPIAKLSRRERQIMDIVLERGRVSAQEVTAGLEPPTSLSAVRTLLARMVEKKALGFVQQGAKYIYYAKVDTDQAQQSALKRVLKTFFKGSQTRAVNALLDMEGDSLSDQELAELERTITRLKSKRSERSEP